MKFQAILRTLKTCEHCQAYNFDWREACYRCHTAFPLAVEAKAVEELKQQLEELPEPVVEPVAEHEELDVALWVTQCGRCGWLNLLTHTTCQRCRKPLMRITQPLV